MIRWYHSRSRCNYLRQLAIEWDFNMVHQEPINRFLKVLYTSSNQIWILNIQRSALNKKHPAYRYPLATFVAIPVLATINECPIEIIILWINGIIWLKDVKWPWHLSKLVVVTRAMTGRLKKLLKRSSWPINSFRLKGQSSLLLKSSLKKLYFYCSRNLLWANTNPTRLFYKRVSIPHQKPRSKLLIYESR
jgi:hypothetical protein